MITTFFKLLVNNYLKMLIKPVNFLEFSEHFMLFEQQPILFLVKE